MVEELVNGQTNVLLGVLVILALARRPSSGVSVRRRPRGAAAFVEAVCPALSVPGWPSARGIAAVGAASRRSWLG